jgi:hypothetical protein
MCRFKGHFKSRVPMEQDANISSPAMVVVDALHRALGDIPLAQRFRVDVMVTAHLQVHNTVSLLTPTRTAANTAQPSSVTHVVDPDTLQQTAMSLQLPSLSRNINGTSQTT